MEQAELCVALISISWTRTLADDDVAGCPISKRNNNNSNNNLYVGTCVPALS